MNYPLHILKILRCVGVCENKENDAQSKIFLVEGWSIEGRVPKVVEHIVINVGLLILHKTKVLIFW